MILVIITCISCILDAPAAEILHIFIHIFSLCGCEETHRVTSVLIVYKLNAGDGNSHFISLLSHNDESTLIESFSFEPLLFVCVYLCLTLSTRTQIKRKKKKKKKQEEIERLIISQYRTQSLYEIADRTA